jgi:C-terminal processing protease CtpA/Prc
LGSDGIIGLPILRRYRVTLDFGGKRMWLAPSANPGAPFERDRSGMNVLIGAEGLRVTHVARGGPAEKAGLKTGDLIVTIDGEMALTANANLTGAPAGKVLDLALADGSRRKLTLAEYY